MKKKFIYYLLTALPFIFCTGCEYELQETNPVEIKKPQNLSYNIQLKASQNSEGEYVVKYENLKFSSELPEDVNYLNFILYREDGYGNSFSLTVGRTSINLRGFYPGKYTLKCEIPPHRTKTGSLADISGYEFYEKTLEWKIVLQQNPPPKLNLRCERLDENTFNLVWDQPDPDYGEVDYYSIIYDYYNSLAKTTDTSYTVTLPQGWYMRYRVIAHFKDSDLEQLQSEEIAINNDNNY
ncbi:MAG: hypothetical protein LBH32_03480 [Dysgonamonadaceae bacterium]|jgi:hypothetical protein|nr:hypothetical protein [Dysgonamonadaceae bacterium]